MKKFLIASIVALTLALVASSVNAAFTRNLTVGSTGTDVAALQNWLISAGFHIPAIESGAATAGYFGSQTKTALAAYQTSVSLPAFGFFGPLTMAKLAAGGTPVSSPTAMTLPFPCPTGYTAPAGWVCPGTTVVSTTPGMITTPGVAGSLTIADGSFTGNGISVSDGQSVDIASFDLQAGASDMQVTSLNFDFNVRPWLYITSLSINDTSGRTLATVSGLTQANFTELIVGSQYRLTIPGVNMVVPAGKKVTVVLHGQFATSNRSAVNIYVTRAEVRAVDGTNVTTTQSIGDSNPSTLNDYVAYAGQNNSNLVVTIDPSSPNTGIIQTNTGTTQTQNVLLGVFDFKSQNINSTLQGLTANVNMTGIGSVGSVFANVQLKTGSTLLTSGTIATPTASTSAVSFTNFNLPLPMNTYVPVSVYATINGGVNGVMASTSLLVNSTNVVGIDGNSNPLTLASSGVTLPSANQSFILSGVNLSNLTWFQNGSAQTTTNQTNSSGILKTTTFSGGFTVTAGSNPIYLSTVASTALSTSTNTASASSTITNFVPSNGIQSYDVAGSYYQITPGSSRSFTVNGTITNSSGANQSVGTGITAINFNSSTSLGGGTALPINFLLQGLNSDFHIQTLLGTN